METIEEIILRELATLPEEKLEDVLAFVRFLKVRYPGKFQTKQDFEQALEEAERTARERQITAEDIEKEIRAVREGR